MKAYADTSFLVSLYVPDTHSQAAAAAMKRVTETVLITALCEVELMNAIQLRVFRKELSAHQAGQAARAFEEDLSAGVFHLEPVAVAVYERAKRLSARHTPTLGVRSIDLLHVAAALVLGVQALCTFDLNQRKLAGAVGLALRPAKL